MANTLKKNNKKGFTLVELVIVIAILAILATIAVPTVNNVIGKANESTDAANAQTVELALKTADAELQSKTWDGVISGITSGKGSTSEPYTPADLTVQAAIIHNGLGKTLPEPKVTSNKYRSKNGKITLSSKTTDGKDFTVASEVHDVLTNAADGT